MSLLTRTTAPYVILFFDTCFKQGVIDACDVGDDLEVKEFYEDRMETWELGPLGVREKYDWHMFRYWLYWLARAHKYKTLAESYIFRIRTIKYSWCILPYCMRFYLLGISEWLKYPNPGRIEIFKKKPRQHWDPNSPNIGISKLDVFSYLHNFEYEYRNLSEEYKPITDVTMGSFIKALYDLSRKYVTKKEEEDF